MALKDTINADLKAALLGGDRFKGEILRGFKAVILNEEVAQGKRDEGLADSEIEQLVAREIKKRNDSATQYEAAGRPELSETERLEAEVLAIYLPEQATEDDIKAVITHAITDLGVTDASGFGQVIGAVKKELGNSADGGLIARLVKDALS